MVPYSKGTLHTSQGPEPENCLSCRRYTSWVSDNYPNENIFFTEEDAIFSCWQD